MTKAEKLQKELDELNKIRETKHNELSTKEYDVIDKAHINQKDLFYLLSKIEWQGKEALGVIRINELMQQSMVKDQNAYPDVLKLTSTEANALLYLMLRIKSNSKHDAKVYTEVAFPIVHSLETIVADAKSEYDTALKPTVTRIDEIERELDALIISTDKEAKEATKKSKSKKPKVEKV